jgi:hypothetical protein
MSDPNETIKTNIFREFAMMLARVYKQQIYPLPFEQVFYMDGIRIRLSIERHVTPDDTQSVYGVRE